MIIIEKILYDYLKGVLDVPVYAEKRNEMPGEYVIFERVGGSENNHILSASFALQSYADTLLEAIELNGRVKEAMDNFVSLSLIGSCHLDSDTNFTDTRRKKYRYQAVYDVVYYNH